MASTKPPPLTPKQGWVVVRPKGESKCSIHGNREIMLCCLDCDQLLCVTCSISTHLGHRQEEMANIIPEKKSSLQRYVNDAESIKLIELESEISLVQSMLVGNDENCKRFRELQELLSSSAKQVIRNEDLLQKYKKELENRYGTLLERSAECKVILESGTPVQVCDAANDFDDGDSEFPDEVILLNVDIGPITSIPTESQDESQDENVKATADPRTNNNRACYTDAENQQQTEKDISNVMNKQDDFIKTPKLLLLFGSTIECNTVHPTTFGVWLRAYQSKELFLVDIRGHIKRRIKTARTITCTSTSPTTNNIWFGCAGDISIYEVYQDSKVPFKRFTVDSEIIGLCLTAKEQVVVLTDVNLVIFTPNGGVLASLLLGVAMTSIHDSLKAGTIAHCPMTKNLAINVRYEEDGIWFGKLMVYDASLQLKFDYSGRGDHLPWKSVYDSRGNIAVLSAGAVERRIQLLSSTGEYIRTIYVDESMDMVGIGFWLDRLWVCVDEENTKKFARNTKSSIYTIEYYKCGSTPWIES